MAALSQRSHTRVPYTAGIPRSSGEGRMFGGVGCERGSSTPEHACLSADDGPPARRPMGRGLAAGGRAAHPRRSPPWWRAGEPLEAGRRVRASTGMVRERAPPARTSHPARQPPRGRRPWRVAAPVIFQPPVTLAIPSIAEAVFAGCLPLAWEGSVQGRPLSCGRRPTSRDKERRDGYLVAALNPCGVATSWP